MTPEINKKISETLGIEPIDLTKTKANTVIQYEEPLSKTKLEILNDKPLEEVIIDEDFNEARENLKTLIQQQQDAISQLTLLADESEQARHYEVLAVMMKNLGDLNDKLLNLSKQRKELTKGLPVPKQTMPSMSPERIEVKGDAVFVGTTADLDKILEERRAAKKEQQIIEVKADGETNV